MKLNFLLHKVPRRLGRVLYERFPEPLHLNILSIFVALFGNYKMRIACDLVVRQQYAFSLLKTAELALAQGLRSVTVIEFGVAAGAGLVNICEISRNITKLTGVDFKIFGFDRRQPLRSVATPPGVQYGNACVPRGSFTRGRLAWTVTHQRAQGQPSEGTISAMCPRSPLLEALGGEEGCGRLSAAFYARVAKDPILRPFFPGKSLRCATEEFGAFLIQFLGGDENQTQYRWWLSLRESHARFQIGPDVRRAWLRHMEATLDDAPLDDATRNALRHFFSHSSAYVIGGNAAELDHEELAARWNEQRILDRVIAAIVEGRDDETLALAPRFTSRPSVFVGLLARMVQTGRARLIHFVINAAESDPSLATRRFAGTTLLHFAAGAGCLEVVALLLRLGADPNIQGRGHHTPLYCLANECASETGPEVVRALLRAGADVNASGGVTRATALHMAARRGHVEIARALLDSGAAVNPRDRKGDTPLQRAINCRKNGVSHLLRERGAQH